MTASLPPRQYNLDGEPLRCISALDGSNSYRITGPDASYLTIPGHGDQVSPNCGHVTYAVKCPNNCDKPILHQSCCHNLTCICHACVKAAIGQKAHSADRRNRSLFQLWKKRGKNLGKLKHVTLSPDNPPDLEDYLADMGESFRRTVIALIREHTRDNVYAGQLVIHPFRFQHEDGSSCEDDNCQLDHFYIYSPHAHFLGYGYFQRSEIFHKETGWIYKNIKPGQRRSFIQTFSYELSHVGIFMRNEDKVLDSLTGYSEKRWKIIGQSYSNIGLFSNANGGVGDRSVEIVDAECPKCHSHLLEHAVDEVPTKEDGVFEIKVLENVVMGIHKEYVVTERWHLNIPQYEAYFDEKGKQRRRRVPCKRIYLDNTYRTDDDPLMMSEPDEE